MNLLILEDDLIQAAGLKKYILELHSDWEVFIASTYDEAVLLTDKKTIHVFLLDIDLNSTKNGVDFGNELRSNKSHVNTPVIFLTSKEQYISTAVNDVHCYGFLPKPYNKERLQIQLNTLSSSFEKTQQMQTQQKIIFKDENGIAFPVYQKDIFAVLSVHRRLKICTLKGEHTTCYATLAEAKSMLPFLIQIRRDCLINPDYIDYYDRTNYILHVNKILYIVGRSYKTALDQLLYPPYT